MNRLLGRVQDKELGLGTRKKGREPSLSLWIPDGARLAPLTDFPLCHMHMGPHSQVQ